MKRWCCGIAVSLVACKFDPPPNIADGGGGIDADVEAAPTVVATTPGNLAIDVEPGGVVTATFSEDMDAATIDATSFVVTRGDDAVAGEVTYDTGSRTATFAPATRLSLINGYTATITTAVTDAGGAALASGHTWRFTIRDGTWGTAQLIETDNGGNAQTPRLAVDAIGTAVAVWHQSDGTRNSVWANRFVAGTGWDVAATIETEPTLAAEDPRVGMDRDGNAIAVWEQTDGTRYSIWANRFLLGTGWGTASTIESDSAGHAYSPQVAVDSAGNAMASWYQNDGTRFNARANRYVPGTGWGTAATIETENLGTAYPPSVAFDGPGNATAVWTQNDGTRNNLWSNRYVLGNGWGTAVPVESLTGDASSAAIAVDAAGYATAVWVHHTTTYDVWANRYVPGTGWGTPVQIDSEAGEAVAPVVGIDSDGNVIAVWLQYEGIRYDVWSNRYVVGTGWGTAELIEMDDIHNLGASGQQVAVDPTGAAVAVWSVSDGTRNNIWANRYIPGTGWGTPQLVEMESGGPASNPTIAVDVSGGVTAVWTMSDGTRTNIWANTFR
jgi:hypothetical protein